MVAMMIGFCVRSMPRLHASKRPVPDVTEPLWQLEAELSGEILPSHVMGLVTALARSERALVVQRLSYTPAGGDRFSLRIAVNFIIERDESGGGS